MQPARLIPVSGIDSEREAEMQAASAFLAVLSVVRDLSVDLLGPLGASKAQRATVDTFTEVVFNEDGKKLRPDGFVRVAYGKSEWTCLLELKTGDSLLEADQINAYWDLARSRKYDHVLTISNEIAAIPSEHPTVGLRVQSNSPVQVTHISWTAIVTAAIRIKQHHGVDDPEQAWILDELIRYLEHPKSGALAFSDMGPSWVAIRDQMQSNSLTNEDEPVVDVANRFDQLLRFTALVLGAETGEDVAPVLPRGQREPKQRVNHLVKALRSTGELSGGLRVPNTAGDMDITVDLRSQTITVSTNVSAPEDRGAKGRVTWLVNQLDSAPDSLAIDSYGKNARKPVTATLGAAREDRFALIGDDRREPKRYRLTRQTSMGKARKAGGRSTGFTESVVSALTEFYELVPQQITPWQPKAPQRRPTEPSEIPEDDSANGRPKARYSWVDQRLYAVDDDQ